MNNRSGLTARAQRIINRLAQDEARKLGSEKVDPEHVFLSLLREKKGIPFKILEELEVNIEKVIYQIENQLKVGTPTLKMGEIQPSERIEKILVYSADESQALNHYYIGVEHLFLGIFREEEGMVYQLLYEYDITLDDLKRLIVEILGFNTYRGPYKEINEKKDESKKSFKNNTPTVNSFSRDLTELAENDLLDPVIERDKEIDRMIQILSRRSKNNPILVGEPGVGKSALVEGLANKIVSKEVPDLLLGKRVVSLDLAACISGTKYRGEFEERIKNIMQEIKKSKNIILFIDEVHTIIGTGGAEGSMDASNIMKPALSRSELQCIGATTSVEYRKYIERDSALSRRFQKIDIEEPNIETAIKILNGLKHRYENFHNVIYSRETIEAAVNYSKRYLSGKFLPDSAIDIIDEAGAKVRLKNSNLPDFIKKSLVEIDILSSQKKEVVKEQDYEKAALLRDKVKKKKIELEKMTEKWEVDKKNKKVIITTEDIGLVVKNITQVPVNKLEKEESKRLINMENELAKKIIGQKNAVSSLSKSYRSSRAGLKSPLRPMASYIFLGPTGVGKSELAKCLAEFIFGTKDSLVKIDMSEFMEKHSVSRLIGSPPGYVGYQEGGELTTIIKQKPYSVILFDEIEKAHPDIFNIFLQVLEDGKLSDQLGNKVDFSNTVIIMTSNLGTKINLNSSLGFKSGGDNKQEYDLLKKATMEEVKKYFSPEFLNRLDEIIVFESLSDKMLFSIIDLLLSDLHDLLKPKKIAVKIDDKVRRYMVDNIDHKHYGARPLRRIIQTTITDILSEEIILKKIKLGDVINFTVKNKQVVYTKNNLKKTKEGIIDNP